MTTHLLEGTGLRRTRTRTSVLQVLTQANRPLTHQEITRDSRVRALDRVTVYRTLETLSKTGLLHRIQGTDGVWRFCGHRPASKKQCAGNHIHFFCSKCNQMACLPEQPLPWVAAPKGATIHSKQLVVHGLCAKCAAKEHKR